MTSETTTAADGAMTTRARILRAAERLFARHGVGRTPTRAILREAGQRNESALQYHFGGRDGLVEALYAERGAEVNQERERMLLELTQEAGTASIRRLCEVALMPPVRLARNNPGFLEFLKVVGQLAFIPSEKLKETQKRYELDSVSKVRSLLEQQLDLPGPLVERRFELVHRMAALTLAQRARSGESFEGSEADLYFTTVLDAMASILNGPVSPETQESLGDVAARKKKPKRPGIKRDPRKRD